MGEKFSRKLGYPVEDIIEFDCRDGSKEEILLVTRSVGFGNIPDEVMLFMAECSSRVIGVVATGNKNWGDNFGAAGDKISEAYDVPLIHKYEGSGFPSDVKIVKEWIEDNINIGGVKI